MKKHIPVYRDKSIIFWPYYHSSFRMICFSGIIILLDLIMYVIETLSANSIVPGLFFLILFLFIVIIIFCLQYMFIKIKLSYNGLLIGNKLKGYIRYVSWNNIKRIEYYQDKWYGQGVYLLYLKGAAEKKSPKTDRIIIPANVIDTNKLQAFIPKTIKGQKAGDGLREP